MVHLANGTVALLYRASRGDEESVVINPTVLINFPKSINLINLFVSRVINDQCGNSKAFES